ncbi:hypothetical protein D3C77_762730 [compost metagenome]
MNTTATHSPPWNKGEYSHENRQSFAPADTTHTATAGAVRTCRRSQNASPGQRVSWLYQKPRCCR